MPTPSVLIVPNRLKAGILYSQLPANGDVDFSVTRATTAYRTNASGILESVASGVPRLDYPIGGGCPSLLVEPAATNLALRSEEFENAYWTLARTSAFGSGSIANATVAPNGTTTADYIQLQTGETLGGGATRAISVTSGTIYSLSVFAKQNDNRFLRLGFAIGTGSAGIFCNFDLQDGIAGTPSAGVTPTITNFGNGWFRCSITATSQVTASASQFIYQANGLNVSTATPNIGIFIWGAQLEVGSVATSYIPTVAATATRNADVISKTGVSGFIGQTEGTLYAEVDLRAAATARRVFLLSDGTADNEIRVTASALNLGDLQFAVRIAGTLRVNSFSPTNVYLSGTFKIAAAYKNADYALYVNGVQVLVSTASGSLPSCSRIDLGSQLGTSNFLNDRIRTAAIYPTRLTNSQLSALTTL
jgi:hypothetical protein